MTNRARWMLGSALVLMMVLVPTVHYRHNYRYAKRLRPVVEGKLYRSGCMTADGLEDAIKRLHIKTVINLQEEAQDPDLFDHYFTLRTTPESEVCCRAGANFVFLAVGLVPPAEFPRRHSDTVEEFLRIMDNPESYPVLIHCKAGLHRTGVLAALYRREYQGWSADQALRELKSHGFGEFVSTSANPYIVQYILGYQPRDPHTRAAQTRRQQSEQPAHHVPSSE